MHLKRNWIPQHGIHIHIIVIHCIYGICVGFVLNVKELCALLQKLGKRLGACQEVVDLVRDTVLITGKSKA